MFHTSVRRHSICIHRRFIARYPSRFATLCFGAERDFLLKHEATGEVTSVLHRCGHALHLPSPMNSEYLHAVPKRKRVKACRISLTFREIVS